MRGFRDALRIGYQERPTSLRVQSGGLKHCMAASSRPMSDWMPPAPCRRPWTWAIAQRPGAARPGFDSRRSPLHGFHTLRTMKPPRSPPNRDTEVVASHEAAAMLGYVARGDTTVADAYLSSVLLRRVREFGHEVAARFGARAGTDAEQWRTRRCRGTARRQRRALRTGGRCRRHGRRGLGRRTPPAGRLRHGWDVYRCQPLPGRTAEALRRRDRRRAAAGADDGDQHDCRWRRLDRTARGRQAAGRPDSAGADRDPRAIAVAARRP